VRAGDPAGVHIAPDVKEAAPQMVSIVRRVKAVALGVVCIVRGARVVVPGVVRTVRDVKVEGQEEVSNPLVIVPSLAAFQSQSQDSGQ
jgi:hypothetical protein